MSTLQSTNTDSDAHQLHCLEVWGGSSAAEHSASVPGLDISVNSTPFGGVSGGDIFLISSCSSGWISRILLADISGHGDAVSELSTKLRRAMHKSINTVDQSKLARTLNAAFDEIGGGTKFATALLMTYYAPLGRLIIVNAGHPPPLLCRAGTTSWHPIDQHTSGALSAPSAEVRIGIRNLPLGVIGNTEYEQIAIKIQEGDRICAFTDGYTEAKSTTGTLLGLDGLEDILSSIQQDHAALPTAELTGMAIAEIQSRGYEMSDDDFTMLTFTHTGESPSRPGLAAVSNMIKNTLGFGHIDTIAKPDRI
jgi:phosphoserine phosphatase RsbU/P